MARHRPMGEIIFSYGVDALRHITIGQGAFAFGLDVAFLAGFTVVMSIIALWLFKRE